MNNFIKAALIRALRTLCQAVIAGIGTAVIITDVNWMYVIQSSLLAALLSLLTSVITGLPEAKED